MANVIAPPIDQYRGTNIVPDNDDSIAWEVADFLFGVESIKKIVSGKGTWGDALIVGVTAATFFIPPAKIGQLGTKTLRKVLGETITVNAASDAVPMAAKAAARTRAEIEAELARRGKLTYGTIPEPEIPTRSMSKQRFEKITSPEPEVDYSAPPIREVNVRAVPTALAERQLRREGGSLRKRNLTDETIDRKTGKQKGNYSEPTEAEVEGLVSGSSAPKGKPRKDSMGPESNPVDFVDDYLDKLTTYKSLVQQLKDAKGATAFRKDVKELKDDEKNLALRKENRSAVKDPENPDAVTPVTEINNQLLELQTYFKENHKLFTKLYDDVYGDETVATIRSFAAVAAGKQAPVTAEEKLIASLPMRPKEVSKARQRIDKQDEALTAQENKSPIDFEASTFQGGTNLKVDTDFTPQLDPKKTSIAPSKSARAEMDELKADLDNAKDNLSKAKNPAEERLYAKAVEQARKAIEERSKILGFTAPRGAARQEQIDLADELFKVQDVRITLKRTDATPKGTPRTRNVADRVKHVKNILAKENKDFVKESPDYAKQLKNKKEFKNDDGTLNVEKYEKRIQQYQDEIDRLEKIQADAFAKTKELAKQLDDNGIRRFMNRVATNKIDPTNRQALIDLIDDLAEQTKDPALKKRIINYVNKLKLDEGITKGEARKAGMNTRLAKEDAARKARFEAKQAAAKSESKPKVEVPNASKITVHSGMATGADTVWAEVADSMGIKTIGHSFKGHRVSGTRPAMETRNELTEEQLKMADKFIEKAAQGLGRPINPDYRNLFRRNYYQVKDSEAVIAVGKVLPDGTKVSGGTGWATQMGIDKGVPVYVFDQVKKSWFKWDGKKFVNSDLPPKFNDFAGIGTRDLNPAGREAIEEYLQQFMKGN